MERPAKVATRDRALTRGGSKGELPPLIKESALPSDFRQQVADLDSAIYQRGVPGDNDRLVSLGRSRFSELLAAERKCRSSQRDVGSRTDLSSFASVQRALSAFETPAVPIRSSSETLAGAGRERDQARNIKGFDELWKATQGRQEVIADIYAFHDLFASLIFGQSLLEQLAKDGRVHSRFFCGGQGQRVDLFRDWLSVMERSFTSVMLVDSLFSLFAWLAEEQALPPSRTDLARYFFNVRTPSTSQERIAAAVLDGFLLGHDSWDLWEYVGRKSRTVSEESRLSSWRKELGLCYHRISAWHKEVRAAFYCDIPDGWGSHRQFEPTPYRAFVGQLAQRLLNDASALLALGIEETSKGAVLARFQNSVLCQDGKHMLNDKRAQIGKQLAAAFPGSAFQLEFEEAP